ncbi:MAG: NAD(P)-dependent oxidoreductase [Chloroflexota bacterium]|nr:NAD(P)-dependent oxidoreductase [Chloroflexota bacterium]MDQ5865504.1 NAD(P)-dependent oxidoreductase [Chloroflexota bacterium]
MKILVTGNLGYVGSVLTPHLRSLGHDVYGLDTGYYKECRLLETEDVPTVNADVRSVTAADLQGFDAVIHLAALSNDPMGEIDPALTDEINHLGSVRLAELAREAGVPRFALASSCSMYGVGGGDAALDERAAFNPQSAYARSKVDAESGISALATEDFSPTFLRFATAYGLSPRLRFDLVTNNLTGWAFTTGMIKIMSDGTPWRPLVHVRDMSHAFATVVEAPRELVHNQAFNVGRNEDNYQIKDIASVVEKVVPNSTVEYAGQAGGDTRTYRVSFNKIRQTLPNFQPQWSLEPGVAELYEAFSRLGLSQAAFQSKDFTRLEQLKYLMAQGQLDGTLRWNVAASTPGA